MTYFFLNTEKKHHVRELARILGTDPSNLNTKLRELESKEGILRSEKRGNQIIYSLNKKFPFFTEYKSIFNRKYGVEWQIKEQLLKLPGIRKALLFGSYAGNRFDGLSDIDLLIIGDQDGLELSSRLSKMESVLHREINPVEITPDEYEKRMNAGDPFLKNIFQNKTIELIP